MFAVAAEDGTGRVAMSTSGIVTPQSFLSLSLVLHIVYGFGSKMLSLHDNASHIKVFHTNRTLFYPIHREGKDAYWRIHQLWTSQIQRPGDQN